MKKLFYVTTFLFVFLLPQEAFLKHVESPVASTVVTSSILSELPVTILEFRGKLVFGQYIRLNWAVRDEIDVDYYEVQKIVQGIWTPLDRIAASGQDEYNYQDLDIAPTNIYRLKIVDLDESFVYSVLVRIKSRRLVAPLTVFPNPFSESFKIINENEDYTYQVFDSMGNLMIQGRSSNDNIEEASISLDRGVYILHVIDNKTQRRETLKIRKN